MKFLRVIALNVTMLAVAGCGGPAAPASAPASQLASPESSPAAAKPALSTAPSAAQSAAAAPPPSGAPVKVRWGVIGLAPEAGIYIAKAKGYFQQEGLEVETSPYRSFSDQGALLASGQLDYGTGAPDASLFNAITRDIPLRIVTANAISTKGDASAAFMVRQDLVDNGTYKDVKDLKGMKLGLSNPGTFSQLVSERILATGGLTKADVTFTTVPFPNMATAFANKGIDAAWEVEPFVTGIAGRKLAKSIIPMAAAYPGSINEVIVISPSFAKQQPDAAKRVMYAFLKGQREYYAAFMGGTNPGGKDEIIQILTKYTALKDAKLYAGMGMSGADPNGGVDDKVLTEMQDYFLKAGTQKQALDMSQVVDRSYAGYAVQRLGKV